MVYELPLTHEQARIGGLFSLQIGDQRLEIEISANTADGTEITLAARGSEHGYEPVRVRVLIDPAGPEWLQTKMEIRLTPGEAKTGTTKVIEVDGRSIPILIDPDTPHGSTYRLPGLGQRDPEGGRPGDLVLVYRVVWASPSDEPPLTDAEHRDKPNNAKRLRPAAIVASLAALTLVLLGILYVLGRAASPMTSNVRKDAAVAGRISQLDGHIPLEERIRMAKSMLSQLPSDQRSRSAYSVSELLQNAGHEAATSGERPRLVHAESWLKRAIELDRTNAAAYADLGRLYFAMASDRSAPADSPDRINLFLQAGKHWRTARGYEADPVRKSAYAESGGQAFYEAACTMHKDHGDASEVRAALYDARDITAPSSALRAQIDQLLDQLH